MATRAIFWVLIVCAICIGTAAAQWYPVGLAATRKVKDLTGPGITQQFSMQATDLGVPVRLRDNVSSIFVFGDTFRDARVGSADWRAPVGLVSPTTNLDGGITWSHAAGPNPGYASQLVAYTHNQNGVSTVLPADIISIRGVLYMWVMVNAGFPNVVRCEIYMSKDDGRSFQWAGFTIPGNYAGGMMQLVTWEYNPVDDFVYIYSTGFQRNKPIIMHRVRSGNLLQFNAYSPWGYRNGAWNWGNAPTPILSGSFGEMSLRRVDNAWVLCFFNAGDYRIDAIVMAGPVSNLFTAQREILVLGGQWGHEDNTHVAQLYGGYTIPGSTLRNFHFVISQWDTATGWPYRSMQFKSALPPLA
eukprot:TRINITY_DN14173_c0_g1_i1.p1 TRINITY_DN14173_c0_g1~~TRINITY_DN14173_c0_g1_i1.p1  ORF type:complete len:357 (+),score=40.45 TRINITY_DN14173_c0_g1_i1:35-1105(+)